jgi:tetratricopeptide (TPR) repeat protein
MHTPGRGGAQAKLAPEIPQDAVAASAKPARTGPQAAAVGDSASPAALQRLADALQTLKAQTVRPLLDQSMAAMGRDDWRTAADFAISALQIDERNGYGWWLLAIAREKAGDVRNALACYENTLQLLPEHGAIANDIGRLAFQLGEKALAAQLFQHFLASHPDHPEGLNNLACALRDLGRRDEGIEVLRGALEKHPGEALLWNTLGTLMNERGDLQRAMVFYEEALRLDPLFAKARYNLASARLAGGDPLGALADCDQALALTRPGSDAVMMRLARSSMLLAAGDLEQGWDEYEARLDPHYAEVTHYLVEAEAWSPESDVRGRTILVVGEQGLGDEVLFANVLPDLIEAIGPEGRLLLAVETRQVALFQRAFPRAEVGAHATYQVDGKIVRMVPFARERGDVDLWAPMASLLRRWRRSLDAYPDRRAFLEADPARVGAWREQLAGLDGRPKVGVLWKSLKQDAARQKWFSAFDQWRPVLETPGVTFVNLQYGDCEAELAQAEAQGLSIWRPPGIDLKDELDEVAALCSALNLVIGPANATSNIAAACGVPTWLITPPAPWPRLGTVRYPWYPSVRAFVAAGLNAWDPVMAEVAQALGAASLTAAF